MAASESHPEIREQMKFMWVGKTDATTGEYTDGKRGMHDLVQIDAALILMPINPHGNWGYLTQNLLCH